MNRFWDIIMEPCLKAINAKDIVEVGSDKGIGTRNLINYCKENGGRLYSIDPFPKYDYKKWEEENDGVFTLFTDLSLSRLPLLKEYDAILLDGDHNWYTVYNELKIIENTFKNKKMPLIFLHDIHWPYARRDLYYNPDNIPVAYRQPYSKKGIAPDNFNLVDEGGLNNHLYNAIYENNPQNGVLTGIEDFINEFYDSNRIGFIALSGFFGLGIIYDKVVHRDILKIIEEELRNQSLLDKVEKERIQEIIKSNSLTKKNIEFNNKVNKLKNENDELSNVNSELSNANSELSNVNSELSKKINRNNIINNKLLEENKNYTQKIDEQIRNNEKLQKIIQEKDKKINDLQIANKIHLSSIRYNLGDVIIKGMRPSIDTLKMPFRIAKLLKQGMDKKKYRQKLKQDNKNECLSSSNNQIQIGHSSKNIISTKERSLAEVLKDKNFLEMLQKDNLRSYEFKSNPQVSIIVVNHNGEKHLKTFFNSIVNNVSHKNIEIIVVDNASEDNSINIINSYKDSLEIKMIENSNNETYSKANNQGAEIAQGEYLLFANNDIEVFEGWLEELLEVSLNDEGVGAVGSLLFYPECPKQSLNKDKSYTIQHCGIKFNKTEERIIPYNYLNGKSPNEMITNTTSIAAVTGASFMISKKKFWQVGGFTEEYVYGYEDVDISLKLIKKGYTNYIVPSSRAYHFEFGTQSKQHSHEVKKRRLNNIKKFKERWDKWLEKKYIESIVDGNRIFFETNLKVAFAVTEAGDDVSAGDYFTAMEFGEAMKNRGWDIQFLKRKGPENWYEVDDDVDILISLLDAYDVSKVKCKNKNLITIGWARNWFDRWASKVYINDYTYVLASSKIACEYMEKIAGRKVHLLQIASNAERFLNRIPNDKLMCDYCFTGSYWNDPREIIDILNPQKYPEYKFNIYGANWDKIDKFIPYNKGFISYKTMPEIYASTKIVIDDANRVTKPYGSVNSRVFDALASGVLVLTNGALGSEYTFDNLLPTYSNEAELHGLINHYLTHEEERKKLASKLQKYVLKNHTYDNRVDELLNILGYEKPKKTVIIKTPVPKKEVAEEWGDYHFALALVKEFEKLGYEACYQYLNEWDNDDSNADIIMVLRGLNNYKTKNYHYNIMWNISHPDDISLEEYYSYDQVYIASDIWTKHVKENSLNEYTKVDTMMQCTDTNVFKEPDDRSINYQLLFVGNSRKVFRKVIKDLIPTKYDLSVFGTNWSGLISDKYIKDNNISNKQLYNHYGNANIVLNDHWEDMREKGFISNRIFDVLASKGFIITDEVSGIEKYFGDSVVTYKDKNDLQEKIELYINNENLRKEKIEEGYNIVVKNHTFEARVNQIVSDMSIKKERELC